MLIDILIMENEIFNIKGLRQFAIENNFDHSSMIKVNNVKLKSHKHWIKNDTIS